MRAARAEIRRAPDRRDLLLALLLLLLDQREPRLDRVGGVERLEAPRDQVSDEDRTALNDLRRRLDAGELGKEGFQTSLRLGGSATSELKRIVFRPPPQDD